MLVRPVQFCSAALEVAVEELLLLLLLFLVIWAESEAEMLSLGSLVSRWVWLGSEDD